MLWSVCTSSWYILPQATGRNLLGIHCHYRVVDSVICVVVMEPEVIKCILYCMVAYRAKRHGVYKMILVVYILVGRMVPLLWSVSLAASLLILAQTFLGETRILEKVVEVAVENPIQPWAKRGGTGQQPHFHRILDTCSKKWAKRVRNESRD